MPSIFSCYESRETIYESILKIVSIFTFYSAITYKTILRGRSFEKTGNIFL